MKTQYFVPERVDPRQVWRTQVESLNAELAGIESGTRDASQIASKRAQIASLEKAIRDNTTEIKERAERQMRDDTYDWGCCRINRDSVCFICVLVCLGIGITTFVTFFP